MIAGGIVVLLATYAGVQYLIARRQVAASKGVTFSDVHIDSINFWTRGSVAAWWVISANGESEIGSIATETSWMGLGRTHIIRVSRRP